MAIAELWEIDQEQSVLLQKDVRNLASNDSDFIATSLHQLSTGAITYALLSPYTRNKQEHGLYQMKSWDNEPTPIIELPKIDNYASDITVFWSPDDHEAIVGYWNYGEEGAVEKQFYYIPNSLDTLQDVTQVLGETAKNLQWISLPKH